MPTFVIFSMGQEPRTATFDGKGVRIGRDEGSDLVLTGRGVSREHALVYAMETGTWMVWCASEKNPVVVDGALLRGDAQLSEGSEILVGTEILLVFSESEQKARSYLGTRGHYAPNRCGVCGWSGMISMVRKDPVCPSCSSVNLERLDTYDREEALEESDDAETEYLDGKELKASLKKLKTAKRSRIERIDGLETVQQVHDLTESEPLRLSGNDDSHFKLTGLVVGEGVEISWTGSRFMISSKLTWPTLKVNGAKVKRSGLDDGDVIEIGNNRFKMATG